MKDAGGTPSIWKVVAGLAIVMSIYAFLMLWSKGFALAIIVFCILEMVRAIFAYRRAGRLEVGFELAFLAVFLTLAFGISRIGHGYPYLFATIFYRPEYLHYGNRRLALLLSVIIVVFVLPVTTGLITNYVTVALSGFVYLILVGALWLFCSPYSPLIGEAASTNP